MNVSDQALHDRALAAAKNFQKAESDLIDTIDAVDRARLFVRLGFSSLFQYCVEGLKLSESVTLNCINVARKSREVPALKEKIKEGVFSISKARKIIPVLTSQNQSIWLAKAETLSQRHLEKEVARENPRAAIQEKASYVTEHHLCVQLGLDEKVMLDFRRAQDLLSQRTGHPATLEQTLEDLLQVYLEAKDPLRRAKRAVAKKGNTVVTDSQQPIANCAETNSDDNKVDDLNKANHSCVARHIREPIPANVLHQVRLRDQGQCTHVDVSGKRCTQQRWLEIHHIKPIANGGLNTTENLTTLCGSHHKFAHLMSRDIR